MSDAGDVNVKEWIPPRELTSRVLVLMDGKPEAAYVAIRVYYEANQHDPSVANGMEYLKWISEMNHADRAKFRFTGIRLWCLFQGVCNGNMEHFLSVIRAFRWSYVSASDISALIDAKISGKEPDGNVPLHNILAVARVQKTIGIPQNEG